MRRIAIVRGISVMLILDSVDESPAGQGSPDVGAGRAGEAKSPERVDLNTAGVGEISRLPGMTTETVERTRGNCLYRNLDELEPRRLSGVQSLRRSENIS
jgi:hypothetical protein